MTFTLPAALQSSDDARAVDLLTTYFNPVVGEPGSYTGAAWDEWDPSGRREQEVDEFTADDCMAVTLLSVNVPGSAAHRLLVKDSPRYNVLLAEVGPDRDLVEVDEPITDNWPASVLYRAVRELPKVGRTKTSKLLARKRPALIPIWDSVIGGVTQAGDYFWEPLLSDPQRGRPPPEPGERRQGDQDPRRVQEQEVAVGHPSADQSRRLRVVHALVVAVQASQPSLVHLRPARAERHDSHDRRKRQVPGVARGTAGRCPQRARPRPANGSAGTGRLSPASVHRASMPPQRSRVVSSRDRQRRRPGTYGVSLARLLRQQGVRVVEVSRPDRQVRRRHGKTDVVDAIAAARAVLSGEASATPKTHDGAVDAGADAEGT